MILVGWEQAFRFQNQEDLSPCAVKFQFKVKGTYKHATCIDKPDK